MGTYLNKNLFLFTSLFLKQTSFIRANVRQNSEMVNNSCTRLVFGKFGDPTKVVELEESSVLAPQDGEIHVRFLCAPVNPADLNTVQGVYPVKPPLPAVPGNEAIGIVEEVGPNVVDFIAGDKVIPNGEALGTWRTRAVLKSSQLLKVPSDIDEVKLAGITSNPSTAYRLLKDFVNLKAGDTIVQNGANSAAGQNVIQLCKKWGINTINIVRDRQNIHFLKQYLTELGATHVLTVDEVRPYQTSTFPKPVLALNCVGGRIGLETMHLLQQNGTMVTYGGMSRDPVSVPTSVLIFKNYKFCGFWMTRWYRENRGNDKHKEMLNDLISYMKSNDLKAPQHQLVPLKDFRIALVKTLSRDGFSGTKYLLDMRQ